jgi:hypothetical protein
MHIVPQNEKKGEHNDNFILLIVDINCNLSAHMYWRVLEWARALVDGLYY